MKHRRRKMLLVRHWYNKALNLFTTSISFIDLFTAMNQRFESFQSETRAKISILERTCSDLSRQLTKRKFLVCGQDVPEEAKGESPTEVFVTTVKAKYNVLVMSTYSTEQRNMFDVCLLQSSDQQEWHCPMPSIATNVHQKEPINSRVHLAWPWLVLGEGIGGKVETHPKPVEDSHRSEENRARISPPKLVFYLKEDRGE